MKLKHTLSVKTLAKVKEIESFFVKPRLQEPGDESSMDWSEDIPEVQSSPTPHVSPAGENMSSPRALLHNRDVRGKRRAELIDSGPLLLNYGRKQPSIPSSWDGVHHTLSIFRIDEMSEIDAINMAQSISRIIDYIKSSLLRISNKLQRAFGASSQPFTPLGGIFYLLRMVRPFAIL